MDDSPFARLAPEVLACLLDFLPARALFKARAVCRAWRACVRDLFARRAARGRPLVAVSQPLADSRLLWLPQAFPAFEWPGAGPVYDASPWIARSRSLICYDEYAALPPAARRKRVFVRIADAADVRPALLRDAPRLRRLQIGPVTAAVGASRRAEMAAFADLLARWDAALPAVEVLCVQVPLHDLGFLRWFPALAELQLRCDGAFPVGALPRGLRHLGCAHMRSVGGAGPYDLPALTSLGLSHTTALPGLFRPERPALRMLDLEHCVVANSVLTLASPNLRTLRLHCVQGFCRRLMQQLPCLQDVDICQTRCDLAPLAACRLRKVRLENLHWVRDLAWLDGSRSTLRSLEVDRLAEDCAVHITGFARLTRLEVKHAPDVSVARCPLLAVVMLVHVPIASLAGLADARSSLVTVSLLRLARLASVSSLMCAPRLEYLSLYDVPALASIAAVATCPRLRTLNLRKMAALRGVALARTGVASLTLECLTAVGDATLSLPTGLRALDIKSLRGLRSLRCLRSVPRLDSLSVQHCVEVEDTRDLACLGGLKVLRARLAAPLWLPGGIDTLTLYGCESDVIDAAPLAGVSKLTWCYTNLTSPLLGACRSLVVLEFDAGNLLHPDRERTISFGALGACPLLRRVALDGWCTATDPQGARDHPSLEEVLLVRVHGAEALADALVTCPRLCRADIRTPALPGAAAARLAAYLAARAAAVLSGAP